MTGFYGMPQFGINSPMMPRMVGNMGFPNVPALQNNFIRPGFGGLAFPFGGSAPSVGYNPAFGAINPWQGNPSPFGIHPSLISGNVMGLGQVPQFPQAQPNFYNPLGLPNQNTSMGSNYVSTVDLLQDSSISPQAKALIVKERYNNLIEAGMANSPKARQFQERAQELHMEQQLQEYQQKAMRLQQLQQQAAQGPAPQSSASTQESESGGGGFLGGLLQNPEAITGLLGLLNPGSSNNDDDDDD